MSAPRTNIDKQKRRHLTPLVGLALVVVFGVSMFLLWMFDVFEGARPNEDTESELQQASPPSSENVGEVDVIRDDETDAQPDQGGDDAAAGE